jgi:hypothetical protein
MAPPPGGHALTFIRWDDLRDIAGLNGRRSKQVAHLVAVLHTGFAAIAAFALKGMM